MIPGDNAASPDAASVGVLTFHRCINYGSYWQARQLVEGVAARGHSAVLLDHECPRATRAEWRCAFNPSLPVRTRRSDLPRYAAKARKFLKAFDALPQSRRFHLDDPADMPHHDTVLIGSDEVWNHRHPWYGGRPLFYGDGVRTRRLASYAASFGNHSADEGLDDRSAQRLRGFAAISVRDENSRRLVRAATGAEPAMVLDPVLQFPPTARPLDVKPSPYVALYGHSFPDWFVHGVRTWADTRGLPLLSIGYRNDWADEHAIEAGPEEFAGLIAGVSAVVTNFFHGCVFALVNDKPFVCAGSAYRSNKLRDLMATVGTEDRLVTEATNPAAYAPLLDAPLDPAVAQRIAALRLQSAAYLDRVLA